MYVSPVKKIRKKYDILVRKDDERKVFHVVCVVKGIEIQLPPQQLRKKVSEMGFDMCFGIKTNIIAKVHSETQKLLKAGYVEEKAPPVI